MSDFLSENSDHANALRFLSIDMVERANSGHPGMPLGMADVMAVLFSQHLKFNPFNANWFDRDRLVLSAGHGCALLYAAMYLSGNPNMPLAELERFRQLGSKTPGHAEYDVETGVEATTGPLGQGLAMAVGMALTERILNARFGDALVGHKTYVICGDGCLAEGIGQEAISIAGHYQLKNLIVLFDDNGITIDGPTLLSTSENHILRFRAAGWNAISIDGHNLKAIDKAITEARTSDKPTLIACKTTIGYGVPDLAGSHKTHGSPLGSERIQATRNFLNWPHDPFVIPDNVLSEWQKFWVRNQPEYHRWNQEYKSKGKELSNYINNKSLDNLGEVLNELKADFIASITSEATRTSSGRVIDLLSRYMPNLLGGSADLGGSNNTKSAAQRDVLPSDYSGSYVNYGIREHIMAAMMNGIVLHGGLVPYSGTFLSFADYARPAIRLSALMKLGVIYIMTHDSIGLGEDGPTHQPVEHLASFRAMPNINVFRPCDAIETFEAWQIALNCRSTPSLIALTRQKLGQSRQNGDYNGANMVMHGGYIIKEFTHNLDLKVTIFATGSEVEIAFKVAITLEEQGYGTRVVSVPCMELLYQQDAEYQMMLTCNNSLKVAIEAACSFGWERLIGSHGLFFGVNTFGHSGKIEDLYQHFGLTDSNISSKILSVIGE